MKKSISVFLIFSIFTSFLIGQSEAVIKRNNSGLTKIEFTDNISNLIIGESSGSSLNLGARNVLLGNYTGIGLVNGSDNTFVGVGAGNVASGNGNVALGYNAGQSSTGDNNVFLGKEAGFSSGAKSNTLWIENTFADSTQALIYGEFDNNTLRLNAQTDIYSDDTGDEGLYVEKTHTGNSDTPAVTGDNTVADYYGIGVKGNGGYVGVQGNSVATGSFDYYGVAGNSYSSNTGTNVGVFGGASGGTTNYGIQGYTLGGPGNYAGYFQGKVNVKANGTDSLIFRIEDSSNASLLSITSNDGVETQDLKTNGSTDLEIESGKRINKAVSMKYYIATEGTFPSNGGSLYDGILLGEIKLFPYISVEPGGWLPCEGQLLNITEYAALFSLIGVEFGGNGTTNFALPDMRKAVPHHE